MHYRTYCWLSGALVGLILFLQLAGASQAVQISGDPQPRVLGVSTVQLRGDASDALHSEPVSVPKLNKTLALDAVSAKSFLVYDRNSGEVLAERNSGSELPIASLTKLMTAWVVYRNKILTDQITVAVPSAITVRPVLGLKRGETAKIEDLFYSMLVGSTNDVADTLASYVQLKTNRNFMDLMNEEARALGMTHSHFTNPVGFDNADHYSTATDIRRLVDTILPFTAFQIYGKSSSYTVVTNFGRHVIAATHTLAQLDSEIFAVKTGYTQEAQGSMVSRAIHDGHEIIIIVIGSPDRETATEALKQAVFDSYTWPAVEAKGTDVGVAR